MKAYNSAMNNRCGGVNQETIKFTCVQIDHIPLPQSALRRHRALLGNSFIRVRWKPHEKVCLPAEGAGNTTPRKNRSKIATIQHAKHAKLIKHPAQMMCWYENKRTIKRIILR